jgi:hypothetical protein
VIHLGTRPRVNIEKDVENQWFPWENDLQMVGYFHIELLVFYWRVIYKTQWQAFKGRFIESISDKKMVMGYD